MKLSERTRAIIKNFCSISNQLIVDEGSVLSTCEYGDSSVYACANVQETFDTPFAIGDLSQFLSVLSLIKEPVLTFGEKSVIIQSEENPTQSIEYLYTARSVLHEKPKNLGRIKTPSASIKVTAANLKEIQNACHVLLAQNMRFFTKDGKAQAVVTSQKKSQGHRFTHSFGKCSANFDVAVRPTFFTPIPDSYQMDFVEGKSLMGLGTKDLYYLYAGEVQR